MCAPAAAGQSVEMAVMPVSLLPNEPPSQALAPAPMLPLAPGRERGTDAHGEIYFLEHSSGATTWTDPLATAVSPAKLSRAQGEYAVSLAELVSTPVRTSGAEPTRNAGLAACKHAVNNLIQTRLTQADGEPAAKRCIDNHVALVLPVATPLAVSSASSVETDSS
jgi:hypothetical protein